MNSNDYILTASQMRAAEQAAISAGVPEYELMERAGAAVADIIWRTGHKRDVLVLCGPGNNGGDGFVIARLLAERGVSVRVAILGESRTDSAKIAREKWTGPIETIEEARPTTQLVDALFGTGLTRGLSDPLVSKIDRLHKAAQYRYAVDVPSGVDSDSGALLSSVPTYTITIALGARKPAHLLYPAAHRCGHIVCVDIGVKTNSNVQSLSVPQLVAPDWSEHKYRRGFLAIVAGSMKGATHLAASAASHAGAGYVKLMNSGIGEGGPSLPNAIVQESTIDGLSDARLSAILIGPGLGRDIAVLNSVLALKKPTVIDADGLRHLANFDSIPPASIFTPHEGEFASLFGAMPGSKIDRALVAAQRSGAVIVYKGGDTVIAAPDGRVAISAHGSTWLSTAGTGDVLAGVCAARLAISGDAYLAACEGVWLHSEAARRAGPAFNADDLVDYIPAAIASRL